MPARLAILARRAATHISEQLAPIRNNAHRAVEVVREVQPVSVALAALLASTSQAASLVLARQAALQVHLVVLVHAGFVHMGAMPVLVLEAAGQARIRPVHARRVARAGLVTMMRPAGLISPVPLLVAVVRLVLLVRVLVAVLAVRVQLRQTRGLVLAVAAVDQSLLLMILVAMVATAAHQAAVVVVAARA